MAKRKVVEVRPSKEDGWDVVPRGGRPISHHNTKAPADRKG